MMKLLFKYCLILFILFFLHGCLESNLAPKFDFSTENASEMAMYLETHGNAINSNNVPWLIDAQTVFDSLSYFLVIDTRPKKLFDKGFIAGSQNVQPKDLLNFIKTKNLSSYSKVVLVSATGQASAYYTTLLRLDGYNNIYSLNFGMASWHRDMADLWLRSCSTSQDLKTYTNTPGPKNPASDFPRIYFRTKSSSVKTRIDERIGDLLSVSFNDYDSTVSLFGPELNPSVDSRRLIRESNTTIPNYLVCYGSDDLFSVRETFSIYKDLGHPWGTVLYAPAQSLYGMTDLMTFPKDKEIIIYCYNGQLSAAATAYLRLFGYNARSLLFGAHILFYDRLVNHTPGAYRYVFSPAVIRDLPYDSKFY